MKRVFKILLSALWIIILVVITSFAPPSILNKSHPLAQGMVGCWPMNEGAGQIAFECSGYAKPGTLTNGALFQNLTRGSCISLDGTNDYIDLGDASALSPSAITVSCLVYFNAFSHAYNTVVSKVNVAGIGFYQIHVKSTGKLALYVGGTSQSSYDPGNITLSTKTWYHLVLTYSAQQGLVGYVNGVQDATAAAQGALRTNTGTSLSIGTDLNTAGRNLNGYVLIDQVWRRALTATEVRQLSMNPNQVFIQNKTGL